MDFIKKHWDKILLSAALLGLIVVALFLVGKIDDLQENVRTAPLSRRPKDDTTVVVDAGPYTNALAQLTSGFTWNTMEHEIFIPTIEPPPTNVVVETFEVETDEEDLVLVAVRRTPFKLLFKAYSWNKDRETGQNFQVNFQFRSRTFFVDQLGKNVADRYEETGFKTVSFERKYATVEDKRLGTMVERDISELVIQHRGDDPITLVLGRVAQEKEPVAWVRCYGGDDGSSQTQQLRRGQRFECQAVTYIVVDITDQQMIIMNAESEEKRTIELKTARPTRRIVP